MTIETRFEWNESVWVLDTYYGRARSTAIYEILANCYSNTPTVRYRLDKSDGMIVPEDKIFKTKEELLSSL